MSVMSEPVSEQKSFPVLALSRSVILLLVEFWVSVNEHMHQAQKIKIKKQVTELRWFYLHP